MCLLSVVKSVLSDIDVIELVKVVLYINKE